MKNRIRLTESDLHRIVKEAVDATMNSAQEKMDDSARKLIEIALKCMTQAHWIQTGRYMNPETEVSKRMAEVTQAVGDLSRSFF